MSGAFEKLKRVVEIRPSGVDKHTVEGEIPVRLCNYMDVYRNERITGAMQFMSATATMAEIERFSLRGGDVVLTKDSETPDDIAVPALVDASAGDVVCGYHLALLRPHDGMAGSFLAWAIRSRDVAAQFTTRAQGVTRFGLTTEALGAVMVPVPTWPEQQAIAAFLDRETAKIDALVAEQKRLLALLEEKRQAVISRAVTQGLDSSVSMKDSGVEWLGQMPAHWSVMPIRSLARPQPYSFIDGDWIEAPYISDEGIRLLQTGNVGVGEFKEQGFRYISERTFAELDCTEVEPGDLLICRLAAPVGRACIAPSLGMRMITSVDVAILKLAGIYVADYYSALFSSVQYLGYVDAACRGGTRDRISRSFLGAIRVCCPPAAEQNTIVNYLDAETHKINELAATSRNVMLQLRERRAALISAAVTGKIDVRGLVADAAPARDAA